MANFNKVMLLGRLTRDPQLSYLPSQTAVTEIGIVVNERRKQQDGSYKEIPCFVDCSIFGKRAEVINKYLKKGDPIFVEGKLQFDSWQGQDGQKRSKLRVFIENFEFIGGNKGGGPQGGGQQGGYNQQQQGGYNAPPQQQQQQQGNNTPPPAQQEPPQAPFGDVDDIPF